jgi:hypothetical protein
MKNRLFENFIELLASSYLFCGACYPFQCLYLPWTKIGLKENELSLNNANVAGLWSHTTVSMNGI